VQGIGFDTLIVCGFAFDPHVSEEVKEYGDLTVLPARMNPDLGMSEDLLKKTGAANLFMVFGEPDLDVRRQKLVVEIRGVAVAVLHSEPAVRPAVNGEDCREGDQPLRG